MSSLFTAKYSVYYFRSDDSVTDWGFLCMCFNSTIQSPKNILKCFILLLLSADHNWPWKNWFFFLFLWIVYLCPYSVQPVHMYFCFGCKWFIGNKIPQHNELICAFLCIIEWQTFWSFQWICLKQNNNSNVQRLPRKWNKVCMCVFVIPSFIFGDDD